jgi:hypothetical protein
VITITGKQNINKMPETHQHQVQVFNLDDKYMLYSSEQMDEFIENGTIHETIREHLRDRYIEALCDLIVYTDINDPDVLADALSSRPDELVNEDRIWFLTNPTIIKTMFPATYTNILNLWAARLSNTSNPIELIDALYQIINTQNSQYDEEVATIWLSYGNLVEVIDLLSEFDARDVITDDADTLLFKFLATMLSEKIRLTSQTNDDGTTAVDILYVEEVQTYLDMLGNYIMPQTKRCAAEIVRAYEAMSEYLKFTCKVHYYGIPRKAHILFANSFHSEDRDIFKGICQAICKLPNFINMTPGYYSSPAIFESCCRFDLPEELESLLVKFGLTPETISHDEYTLKIVAKLLLAAVKPVLKPQILDVISRLGILTWYQNWFRAASLADLQLIDSCQFPLVAFNTDLTLGTTFYTPIKPPQSVINLRDYQSPALLIQFLRLHDLTNPDKILTEYTDKTMELWLEHGIDITVSDEKHDQSARLLEYIRQIRIDNEPNLVRNKLYQLKALESAGYISPGVYNILEQEVFAVYLNQMTDQDFEKTKGARLFHTYKPKYTPKYLAVILTANTAYDRDCYTHAMATILGIYPELTTTAKPKPVEILSIVGNTQQDKIKCSPATLICKFSQLLKEIYPDAAQPDIPHNDILSYLHNINVASRVKIDMLGTIQIYSTHTGYHFQLNNYINNKLLADIPTHVSFGVQTLINNSIFYKYYSVLARHTNLYTAREIWRQFLNAVYLNGDGLTTTGEIRDAIAAKEITPELCSYMCQVLTDTPFLLEINTATSPGLTIRTTDENLKKQAISRWRKWSADRQITYTEASLFDIFAEEYQTEIPMCPISYEPIQLGSVVIRLTLCGHIFLAQHIDKWCQINPSCPMCRNPLPDSKLNGAACEMFELV